MEIWEDHIWEKEPETVTLQAKKVKVCKSSV